eukprot:CAMPEP_0195150522 /NCGR_PEP_ID=MMETSP0448-20130528/178940_1 /TAXON_ID=66468 /ORGANISM="Heterocapsa triquestra, Strain CCMP 448" /LENGTH=47 /DNA_ID= /DNA_START= /DNA_END= /DNA_ORIENTATION=
MTLAAITASFTIAANSVADRALSTQRCRSNVLLRSVGIAVCALGLDE